jgi:hypothetical protein
MMTLFPTCWNVVDIQAVDKVQEEGGVDSLEGYAIHD